MYSRILVPVDVGHLDRLSKALDVAAQIAKENEATLVFVGVVDAVPTASSRTEEDRQNELLDNLAAEQAKTHGINTTKHLTLRSDLHLRVGSDIIKAAEETGCDLIVMASHVPGIKEHLLSSNAGYVASHAAMSVYVIR